MVGLNLNVLGEFDAALEARARVDAIGGQLDEPRLRRFAAWPGGWVLANRGDRDEVLDSLGPTGVR